MNQFKSFPTIWNEYVSKSKIQCMKGFIAFVLLTSLFQCGRQAENEISKGCGTKATVVDMTGLDGCGLMFELEDGSRLEPELRTYIKAPSREEDPMYYFELEAGKKVTISWEESLALSACMGGRIVFITCIAECEEPAE